MTIEHLLCSRAMVRIQWSFSSWGWAQGGSSRLSLLPWILVLSCLLGSSTWYCKLSLPKAGIITSYTCLCLRLGCNRNSLEAVSEIYGLPQGYRRSPAEPKDKKYSEAPKGMRSRKWKSSTNRAVSSPHWSLASHIFDPLSLYFSVAQSLSLCLCTSLPGLP